MRKIKKIATLGTIILILVSNSINAVYAVEEPAAPAAPSEPVAPKAPATPEAPKAPKAPATPEAPTAPAQPEKSVVAESEEVISEGSGAESTGPTAYVNENKSGGQNGGGETNTESVINTGDANTNGVISNVGNINTVATGQGASIIPTSGASIVNAENGTNSANSGAAEQSVSVETSQGNSATIKNNLTQNSTTGGNSNNSNTGGSAIINTGDANTSGSIVNLVNTNSSGVMVSEFNIVDNHTGDYVLDYEANCIVGCAGLGAGVNNGMNGDSSDSSATAGIYSESAVFQNNEADIENNMTLEANSGDNVASRNTNSDSVINTGDANVAANIANFANNNFAGNVFLGTVNIYGSLEGDIILPEGYICSSCTQQGAVGNVGNGDLSENSASVDITDEYLVGQANMANIDNNVNIDAETGDNSTSRNTSGSNSIETGEAGVIAQVVNVANNNIAGGDWWLVIVNEAGNWIGKILGAPDGANFAASEGVGVSVNKNGDITVANNGNGAGSTNTVSVAQTSNTTVAQSNNANIVNNVNLSANTGGNSASRNTGGSNSITTGDANVILNIINFVNNNVASGGRLFVTLVNVFGDWTGDFVSPGAAKAEDPVADFESGGDGRGGPAPDGAGQAGDSGSGSSGSFVSSSSASQETEVLASVDTLDTGETRYWPRTQISSPRSEEQEEQVALAGKINGAGTQAKSIDINLAWGLLLLPLYLIIRIIRRRLAA